MKTSAIEDAWKAFFESNKTVTIEQMNAEGWKTVEQVASESGLSLSRVSGIIGEGGFDVVKKKAQLKGRVREMNFIRPKV